MRGDKPEKKNASCPWPPLPLREAIYIYIHTMFVFPPSFSLGIFMTPLRKSDNLCGSLAIPSQVYEHK